MKKSIFVSALAGMACAGSMLAADLPSPLTVESAIGFALEHNPELQVARHEISRAEAQQAAAGRLANPELELGYSTDQFGEDEGEQTIELGFTQQFPLTARLRKEKNLRRAQLILARAEFAARQLDVAHAVDEAVMHSALIHRKIENQSRLRTVNQEVIAFLRQQAERGEVSSLDVTQAALTSRRMEQSVRQLEAEARSATRKLQRLMGVTPGGLIHIQQALSLPSAYTGETLSKEALLQRRPDYLLALAGIDAAGFALELEKARRWDDVALRLYVEQEETVDEPGGLGDNTLAGIGLSIPLPLMQRNQEGLALAQVEQQAAESKRHALEQRIWSEYQQALQNSKDQYSLAREINDDILRLAEKNFEDIRQAYLQGQASLVQVQRGQEQVLDVQVSALEASAQFFESQANLRRITAAYKVPTAE